MARSEKPGAASAALGSSGWGVNELNDAVDRLGPGPYQLIVLLLGGGVYAAEGSLLLIITIIAKNLITKWAMSPILAGSLATLIFVGLLLGTVIGGFQCDKVGRKIPIMLTYAGIVLFLLAVVLSPGLIWISISKLLLGFAMGFGVPAANAIVCESCPTTQRANIYCLTMVLFSFGQMYSALILWLFDPNLGHENMMWRTMLALCGLPPLLLCLASYFFLQESPHWLVANGHVSEAQDVVRAMIRYQNDCDFCGSTNIENIEEILKLPVSTNDGRHSSIMAAPLTAPYSPRSSKKSHAEEEPSKHGCCGGIFNKIGMDLWRVKVLFNDVFRSTTIIMCIVAFASNFAYYGMIYGLPSSLKTEAAAAAQEREMEAAEMAAAGAPAPAEAHVQGGEDWSPAAGVFFSAAFEIPGVFLAIALGTTISRKLNMNVAFFSCAACLCYVSFIMFEGNFDNSGFMAIFGVKLFVALAFIIVYLYLLECYPTTVRGTGLAFCMVIGRCGAFVCPFVYDGFVLAKVHHGWFFCMMAIMLFLAGLLVIFLPFETKGMTLQEDVGSGPPRKTSLLARLEVSPPRASSA